MPVIRLSTSKRANATALMEINGGADMVSMRSAPVDRNDFRLTVPCNCGRRRGDKIDGAVALNYTEFLEVPAMEWTDTRPVAPGYYWVRFTDDRSPKQTIGEIADVPGNGSRQLVVVLLGDDEILELDDPFFDRALFAGPMDPPSME
ncbi:hypothetical protein PQR37_03770 [Paraburkholderia nemoris]|jgi:hypothetical protein|uniref:hypothetical protein n=1 Tax=Paraburkholderia nemoris TaxID=2793076 RepID=UPI000A6E2528|nr:MULTISPECIES: hypothetical protein [Paraburkholderia]MBK5146058.1 hypothetical protein [Burkholderia sp. R-69608]MBK3738981.1 hypothetical protein [Paraburkholderia aspalathi]MBK3781642.1 hypothetical protein [Paraburkholderia aspalathi]MBK3812970.1 hypothetical protein [Paraburkholderia aspalathi]CAE6709249.1 hypothetical protein R75461_00967 [Paraburkholderia nemoris]